MIAICRFFSIGEPEGFKEIVFGRKSLPVKNRLLDFNTSLTFCLLHLIISKTLNNNNVTSQDLQVFFRVCVLPWLSGGSC